MTQSWGWGGPGRGGLLSKSPPQTAPRSQPLLSPRWFLPGWKRRGAVSPALLVGWEMVQGCGKQSGRSARSYTELPDDPVIPTPRCMLERNKHLKTCLHRNVYSSIIQNNPRVHQLRDGKSQFSITSYQYYCFLNRNKALIRATSWTSLENITLSERSQTQRPYFV